ncbi:MAG TPA: hypothetical protein VGH76_16340 [Actinomycetospora sp.]|uniref:hypothetical protein n=1 Tax=Actinomycetospora sp. TaxID=1872135 RepID=UPI002F40AE79
MYTADAALLHDIGHEVVTLSALVAAVRVEGEFDAAAGARMRVLDDGPGPERGPAGARGKGLAIVRSPAHGLAADVTSRPRRGGGALAEVVLRDRDTRRPPVSGREVRA